MSAKVRVTHESDGSVHLLAHVEHPGQGASPQKRLASGDKSVYSLFPGSKVIGTFIPAPTPPGNDPHGLKPVKSPSVGIQRVAGTDPIDGSDDDGKHLSHRVLGQPFEIALS